MPYKPSPSSLNLMKDCSRCFWLAQHKVWKRPSGIFPSLPSGMDRILKIHFDKFRDKGQLPPELFENGKYQDLKLFDNKNIRVKWVESDEKWYYRTEDDLKGELRQVYLDIMNAQRGKKEKMLPV